MGKQLNPEKLQKLLALTASSNEGEASNAAAMLCRALREAQIDLTKVLRRNTYQEVVLTPLQRKAREQAYENERYRRANEEFRRRQQEQKDNLRKWQTEQTKQSRRAAAEERRERKNRSVSWEQVKANRERRKKESAESWKNFLR